LFSFPSAVNNPDKRTLDHDTNDTVMVHNIGTGSECEVRLKASGDVIINSPGLVQVNCTTAEINASESVTIDTPQTTVTGDMLVQGVFTYVSGMVGSGSTGGATASITGNVVVSDDVVASGISLVNHTHGGVQSGSSNTDVPN